ncbi:hypothetical protein CDAR_612311 [Caerostris darwini]|uniref:Uncharacterized protein n=1 Tax=Caerostris darwini TaxID=1538125 RepID=A0AAV4RYJ3_9ARAC|nr:hypothetical protein CDAR_612311 [Caerostris darwini]
MTVRNHVFDDYNVHSGTHVEMAKSVHLTSYLAHELLQNKVQVNIAIDETDLSAFLNLKYYFKSSIVDYLFFCELWCKIYDANQKAILIPSISIEIVFNYLLYRLYRLDAVSRGMGSKL